MGGKFQALVDKPNNRVRRVFITGVSKGLGKALFDQFLSRGCFVYGLLRDKHIGSGLIQRKPNNANYIIADVSADSCIPLIRNVVKFEKIDLIINNAGIQGEGMSLDTATADEIMNLVNVHCLGAFRVLKALNNNIKPDMTCVINVSSRLGSVHHQQVGTFRETKSSYAYRIAKAAQNMLTVSLRSEFDRVKFVSLTPGRIKTEDEYRKSASEIISYWELGRFENVNGIVQVPDTIIEW